MAKQVNRVLKLRIFERFDTQSEFARENGIDQGMLSRVVNGYKILPESEKIRWAELLSSDVDELFGNEKPKKKLLIRNK